MFSIGIAVASDTNGTDVDNLDSSQSIELDEDNGTTTDDDIQPNIKTKPVISIKSNSAKSKDTLYIYLKNSTGSPLKSKELKLNINNKKYSISTDSKGMVSLKISLPAKNYNLKASFSGDDKYKSISKNFKIKVSKINTKISSSTNFLVKGRYLYVYLAAENGEILQNKKINLKVNGKTYTRKTDKNGRIKFKVNLRQSTYNLNIEYAGNDYYNSKNYNLRLHVMYYTTINIANSRLLSNGFLRIYLKDYSTSDIAHKKFTIKIANKRFTKTTTAEGVIAFKPKLGDKEYKVFVKYGNYWVSKKIRGIIGDVKDPLKNKISLKNGIPDIDLMPGNYIMGDDSATYTLTKAQYQEVLKRDSYCLFLYGKLSKYTFFKTKSHPNTNHIIKRVKWNVIEREINKKLVKANKYNYWPGKVTVSLKGKSYIYPEVRDVQNTAYTCGPTSASVCSQVLRNYVSEAYLAKEAGSKPVVGTPCHGIIKALAKKNYECEYFYKKSFDYALKELKKGGCAIIFHTKNHYVAILDISKDGKKVLVSNSYKDYYNIPTKWLTVNYMKTRFIKGFDDSLLVRLNYSLSNSAKNQTSCFYSSMGTNWIGQNTRATIGFI